MTAHFKAGDYVVYRKKKVSLHPGPHAKSIYPAPNGDYYSYDVNKFWTVVEVQANDEMVVWTRRGKRLTLNASDPALRRAGWWERLLFRRRFPPLESAPGFSKPSHL